ncbi:MAG TPA: hypothetical protein VKB18_05865 [Gemmatimonadota bacterium]|nr:hypothetical protein [Gemmatimonadota bacterium]
MKDHITVVAVLQIALGALGLLGAAIMFLTIAGGGFLSGDVRAWMITSAVATIGAGFLVLVSLPSIVGGFGLLRGRSWARILLLVVAVFEVVHVPLGTLLAIYTFWVLLSEDGKRALAAQA